MYLIGVAIFIFGSLFTCTLKGVALAALFQPVAIIAVVLLPPLAVLTGTGSYRTFCRGFKAATLRKHSVPEDEIGKAASLFRLLSKVTALSAVMCIFIGAIAFLADLNDIEAMGHAISSALVAPVLAIILIAGVYEPIVFVLKRRQSAGRRRKGED